MKSRLPLSLLNGKGNANMTKSLKKDFFREIKKNFGRFISILLIVALGVAFYFGIRSAMPAMQQSADAVYDKQNLMDIRVLGALGLTEGDVAAISQIDGVEDIEGSYSTDFLCLANSKEIVTKVIAMPDRINDITVTEGRFPERYNECVASKEFLEASGLKVGDFMTLVSGDGASVFDTLAAETYTIVGVCSSSFFLNGDMGTSTIGDGVVGGFVSIPKEAFVTDIYTSVYLTVEGAKDLDCFSDEYKETVDHIIGKIKNIADRRCDIRYSEVRSQSNDLLSKARDEYLSSKQTAESELAEAKQKLLDEEQVLEESKKLLEEKKEMFQDAENQIPLLEEGIRNGEKELKQGEAELNNLKRERESRAEELERLKKELEALKNDPEVSESEKNGAQMAVSAIEMIYNQIEQQIVDGEKEYERGAKELEEHKNTLQQLIDVKNGSTDIIAENEKLLLDADIKLQRGKEQYEIAEQDAENELADAQSKLTEKENEINNMEIPVWYVLGRNSVESFVSYSNDAESIGAIGSVFPIIFFLVAALVCLTTMTRMVAEQRTQIGTLKALGYSKASIMSKYIIYALLATVLGSVIGIAVGHFTIPGLIVKAYKMLYYNLGEPVVGFNLEYGLTAALAAVICTTAAAYSACRRELRSAPAELMRPESPKFGKKILIERIRFIWIRLNFSQKSALRNLFRYKKRFLMTLFGVGGCMALLLVGLGVHDSVAAMSQKQYGEIMTYDVDVSVDANLTRAQRRAMFSELSDITDIKSALQINRTMVYAASSADTSFENEENAYLIVPRNIDDFKFYINLKERTGLKTPLELSDKGVIITEKYADILGAEVGDSILIRQDESDAYPKEVKVVGITENYIFNYIYMTPGLYQLLYSTAPDINMLMLKTADSVNTEDLSARLLAVGGINSVSMNSDKVADLDDTVNRLYFVIIIMIVAAGILAFVVLYNLNNINISERRRELATIKLLGFYDNELAAYVYRENIILTVLGIILGTVLGVFLHRFIMTTVETDMYMFGRDLSIVSVALGALLTVIFSVIVNLVMYFKLKKIDMVESLKSVE